MNLPSFAWPVAVAVGLAVTCVRAEDDNKRMFQGERGFVLAGPENAIRDARVYYLDELRRLAKRKALDANSEQVAQAIGIAVRLKSVAVKLYPHTARWDWDLHVADSSEVNAWCMPGGKMLIYSALMKPFAGDDAAIAFALAHEISHAVLEHGRAKQDRELYKNGVLWLLTRSFRVGSAGTSSLSTGETLARSLPMSRRAELDADTLGLELMSRAGYDPSGAIRMLEYLARENDSKEKSDFLATHPLHGRRIAHLQQLMPAARALLAKASDVKESQ